MVGVGTARGNPRTDGAGFVDAFFENLALAVLAVVKQLVRILRRIQLPRRGIDTNLSEQAFHAEGARLIGNDGHHVRTERLVLQQHTQQPHEGHGGGNLAITARI